MHLLVSADSSPLTSVLNGIFYAHPPARPILWSRYREIASDPRVAGDPSDRSVAPGFAIPNQQGDSYEGYPTLATTPEFFTRFEPGGDRLWAFAEGRPFDKNWEAVLGAAVARASGLKLGDTIFLTHGRSDAARRQRATPDGGPPAPGPSSAHEEAHEDGAEVHTDFPYSVVGILEPTGSGHDRAVITNLESSWIIHGSERLEQESGSHRKASPEDLTDADRKITGVYVRCVTRPGSDASAVMPSVAAELRKDPSITVADPTSEIKKLFRIVGNVNQILLAMAGVVMISSGIAIMLALYNSMEQRRRQIAVLRVLGCSRPRIFSLILTESAVLGLLGAAIGLALAFAGVEVVAAILKDRLGLVVAPSAPPVWVVGVLAATVVLAAVAGLVPALMAYRTPVARNLRPIG